jgi:predicted transcriptional regulator
MTDTRPFKSKIDLFVNDKFNREFTLIDDPADHRGVLSWHNQIKSEIGSGKLNEAGSYGYLIKVPISEKELEKSKINGTIKVRLQTKFDGGIAIYGKSFGRYPINPSLVLVK